MPSRPPYVHWHRRRVRVPELEALNARMDAFIERQPGLRLRLYGPQDFSDLSPEDMGLDHRTRHREWWKAVRMLLTTREGDLAAYGWVHRQALRVACLICMLTPRRPICDEGPDGERLRGSLASYNAINMGAWDHRELYAGWEEMHLSFHLRQFRYEIFSDGDWNM